MGVFSTALKEQELRHEEQVRIREARKRTLVAMQEMRPEFIMQVKKFLSDESLAGKELGLDVETGHSSDSDEVHTSWLSYKPGHPVIPRYRLSISLYQDGSVRGWVSVERESRFNLMPTVPEVPDFESWLDNPDVMGLIDNQLSAMVSFLWSSEG